MDWGAYSNCVNVLQGYLKLLGLKRRARDVGSLQDYLQSQGGAASDVA